MQIGSGNRHRLTAGLRRGLAATALVAGASGASLFALVPPAGAITDVTLHVDPSGTSSTCLGTGTSACKTIQKAITRAENHYGSTDDVTIDVSKATYDEHDTIAASGLHSLTIDGSGAFENVTTVDGSTTGRVFTINSGDVTLLNLEIDNGDVTGTNDGGGVYVGSAANAFLNYDFFGFNGSSLFGGAVYNDGDVTLDWDEFAFNQASNNEGGAVYNDAGATANLDSDLLYNNEAADGGGLFNHGTAYVDDTTLADNEALGGGGAVENIGTVTLTNDTSAENGAAFGGGTFNEDGGAATLTFDTFSQDLTYDGAGVENRSGTVTVADSILNSEGCGGTIGDGGYNVESDNSCGFGSTDVVNSKTIYVDQQFEDDSETVITLPISSGSSAFEEVAPSACAGTTTDERGLSRPGVPGHNCDAGAYELQQDEIGLTSYLSTVEMHWDTPRGEAGGVQFVTVTNSSEASLGNLSLEDPIASLSGSGASHFALVTASDGNVAPCNVNTPLAPQQSCSIGVEFLPGSQTSGVDGATLTIGDNGIDTETVSLSGDIESPNLPSSSVTPSALTLDAPAGSASPTGFLVVKNTSSPGGPNLVFHSPVASLSGSGASYFSLVMASDGTNAPCNVSTPLAPGQSCSIGVVFNASSLSSGTKSATVTIGDNGSSPETATVKGKVT